MDIRIYQNTEKLLVSLTGKVVLDECDRLKNLVVPRIVPGIAQVHLEMSEVEFIDSAGLGVLVGMKVSSNKSRSRLTLLNPSKGVSDILMVSKLDSIFDILSGGDAEQVMEELCKPDHLVSAEEGPEREASVAQAPVFQAPPDSPPEPSEPDDETPKQKIDRYCRTAVEHMRRRDYEQASECYMKALELDEGYLPAHNNLAIVYEKKPQWQDLAVKQWERVLEISQQRGDQKHIERAQKHLASLQST